MKPGVTGIGGVFFKSDDPIKLTEWYKKHLNFKLDEQGYMNFSWRESDNPEMKGLTVWSPFPKDTEYFNPGGNSYMINYRVHELDKLLKQLREAGVEVDEKVEEYDYGKFAWIMDPEGNRVELWEPSDDANELFGAG
ncbi:VOC family protein [Candidatus Marinimicrobia bacterium MT.SAG.3]|nr:VOC family protein [Candidatus Marinimicrobia bacterium MT.SAG.3]